jgi:hypothetical protein
MIAKRQGSTDATQPSFTVAKSTGNASARSMVRSSLKVSRFPEGIWKPQKLNVKAREEGWCGWVLVGYVERLQYADAMLRNVWK